MSTYYLYLFIAGTVGGFLSGLLGIGGGIIYILVIPTVLLHFGTPHSEIVQYTIANSIFAAFFASLAANIVLVKRKSFYLKESLFVGLAGAFSAILFLQFIVNTGWYSRQIFNIVVVLLLIFMLFRFFQKFYFLPKASHYGVKKAASVLKTAKDLQENTDKKKLTLAGLAGGALSALSGLGGGIIIIPILNTIMHIDIKKTNAISLGVIAIISLMMTAFNMLETPHTTHLPAEALAQAGQSLFINQYSVGYIIFPVALSLALGAVIASPFGVTVSKKVSSKTIYVIFSFFLIVVIIKKITEIF